MCALITCSLSTYFKTEYGPPKVNLSCSDEGHAIMTSEPTGSLSATELQDGRYILGCTVDWTCTNGTAVIKHQDETLVLYNIVYVAS